MKDDSLSDVQKETIAKLAVKLWKDENERLEQMERNPVNCPHGIAMDIYCEKCEHPQQTKYNITDEQFKNFINATDSTIVKRVWNMAIEEAARTAFYTSGQICANEIRKLGKR
jgi:hypothetical protein